MSSTSPRCSIDYNEASLISFAVFGGSGIVVQDVIKTQVDVNWILTSPDLREVTKTSNLET
jgi:hypothetical protein